MDKDTPPPPADRDDLAALPVPVLRDLAAQGDGRAALSLGYIYTAGERADRDLVAARAAFAIAAKLGCTAAEAPLAALLANGAGGQPRRWQEAMARFAASAAGDAARESQACLLLAMPIDDRGDPLTTPEPQFLSADPLVVTFPDFMTAAECDAMVGLARPRLTPAQVVDPGTGRLIHDPVRDSSIAAFPLLDENPFLHAINRRIAAASRSTPEQGEPTQVLVYEPGQQYRMHTDALPHAANQRIQTVLVYLSDDFQGGETHFPAAGLSIRPVKGHAICFSNVSSDMRPGPSSRHSGQPVTGGTKYVLSKWIRQRPLDLTRQAPRAT